MTQASRWSAVRASVAWRAASVTAEAVSLVSGLPLPTAALGSARLALGLAGRGLGLGIKAALPRLEKGISQAAHAQGQWYQRPMRSVADWMRIEACFAAGTPLRTPDGSKLIDHFQAGDRILSRDETNPDAPVMVSVVEEVFVRLGRIMVLRVGGQVIRTTAEHPFWRKDAGWTPCGELQAGDLLCSHDGQWVMVEEVCETGAYETVYNLRVSDFHTYFIGSEEWDFSVWAHNANYKNLPIRAGEETIQGRKLSEWAADYVAASTPGRRTPKAAWGGDTLEQSAGRAAYQKVIAYAEQHLGYTGKKSHSPGGGGTEEVRQLTGKWTDEIVEAGGGTVRSGGGTSRYASGREAGVEIAGTWRKPDAVIALGEGPLAGTRVYVQTVTVRGKAGRPHSHQELPQALDIAQYASTQGRPFEVILIPKTGEGPMWRVNAAGTGIERVPRQATGADLLAYLVKNPKG